MILLNQCMFSSLTLCILIGSKQKQNKTRKIKLALIAIFARRSVYSWALDVPQPIKLWNQWLKSIIETAQLTFYVSSAILGYMDLKWVILDFVADNGFPIKTLFVDKWFEVKPWMQKSGYIVNHIYRYSLRNGEYNKKVLEIQSFARFFQN